jgi:type VI protein secretion system component Hcp
MSFSHGLSHPPSTTDGVSGKLSVAEITVTKATDRASVQLIEAAALGKVFAKAEIAFAGTNQDKVVAYLVIELTNAESLRQPCRRRRPAGGAVVAGL